MHVILCEQNDDLFLIGLSGTLLTIELPQQINLSFGVVELFFDLFHQSPVLTARQVSPGIRWWELGLFFLVFRRLLLLHRQYKC